MVKTQGITNIFRGKAVSMAQHKTRYLWLPFYLSKVKLLIFLGSTAYTYSHLKSSPYPLILQSPLRPNLSRIFPGTHKLPPDIQILSNFFWYSKPPITHVLVSETIGPLFLYWPFSFNVQVILAVREYVCRQNGRRPTPLHTSFNQTYLRTQSSSLPKGSMTGFRSIGMAPPPIIGAAIGIICGIEEGGYPMWDCI